MGTMDPTARGLLLGIEGIDAVGKRTQTSLLLSWINSRGLRAASVSFPDYGTVIGQEIRAFLHGRKTYPAEVRHMLFAANRWERKRELENSLAASDLVIVNRYTESNLAYGTANGLDFEWLRGLEEGLPKTDAVFLLDADPASLYPRRGIGKDKWERNFELQEKVRSAYLGLAKRSGWSVVDASGGIQPTHQALTSAVGRSLDQMGRTV